jgi:RNA polymerase sigma factor (sigma-70 family)
VSHSAGQPGFQTTRWSLIVRAGDVGSDSQRHRAIEQLCAEYWYPLYAFLRRKGQSPHEAEDTTQGFLATVLEGNLFESADPDRGRFRSFLLTALQRYAGHQRDYQNAEKRGGLVRRLSLDTSVGERRYQQEPADEMTPERIFERRWAITVLQRALARVATNYDNSGKSHLFAALKHHLDGGAGEPYLEIAERFEMTEGAIKAAAHRLRDRYRQAVRDEVGETLSVAEDIDDEIRRLMQAVRG